MVNSDCLLPRGPCLLEPALLTAPNYTTLYILYLYIIHCMLFCTIFNHETYWVGDRLGTACLPCALLLLICHYCVWVWGGQITPHLPACHTTFPLPQPAITVVFLPPTPCLPTLCPNLNTAQHRGLSTMLESAWKNKALSRHFSMLEWREEPSPGAFCSFSM